MAERPELQLLTHSSGAELFVNEAMMSPHILNRLQAHDPSLTVVQCHNGSTPDQILSGGLFGDSFQGVGLDDASAELLADVSSQYPAAVSSFSVLCTGTGREPLCARHLLARCQPESPFIDRAAVIVAVYVQGTTTSYQQLECLTSVVRFAAALQWRF